MGLPPLSVGKPTQLEADRHSCPRGWRSLATSRDPCLGRVSECCAGPAEGDEKPDRRGEDDGVDR